MSSLKDIVSISGMGGLHKVVSQRNDGLIVCALGEERSKFVPNRTHIFTPLEGITIYTYDDTVELTDVLREMKEQADKNPPVTGKDSNDAHRDYLRNIIPSFDEERVYVSDIKKLIKWFNLLMEHDLIPAEEEADATPDAEVEVEEVKEDKPKEAKKGKKKAKKDDGASEETEA